MRSIKDFTWPEEFIPPFAAPLIAIIREWAEKEVLPYRREYDEDWMEQRLIMPPLRRLLGEYGLQRFLFPDDLGGMGMGNSNYIALLSFMVFEEIARADSGMDPPIGMVFVPLLFMAVEPHVNRRLLQEFAPMFCGTNDAAFAALGMTEQQGGSDIENVDVLGGGTIQTTAVRDGDEWVINGHKLWPANTGGLASLIAVVCTTNPGSNDPRDIAVIYVPGDAPGVTQGNPYEKGGMASCRNSDVWLENVRVPLWYRACGPGEDAMYFGEALALMNMGSIAYATGVMMNIHERLMDFTTYKMYRGRPLKENDAAAGVLADFAATTEALRILGYHCARMCDRSDLYGPRWSREAIAKTRAHRYFAADRCMEAVGRVMNLMESFGADRDWDVEKHWRDISILHFMFGGKQLCQMEVARWFYECETL